MEVAPAAGGPRQFRASTPWGAAVIGMRGPHVSSLRPPVPPQHDDAALTLPDAAGPGTPPVVRRLGEALDAWLSGDAVELATHAEVERWLDAAGVTGFRRDTSLALFDVPRGMTLTYGELATLAGRPGAARAAGSACARNPLPIVIPCHRVIHAGARRGEVGSYGAATGTAYKRRLLELEDAVLVRVALRGS